MKQPSSTPARAPSLSSGNRPTVTVGIPAHNEAGTIAALLQDIFAQACSSITLNRVVVICDGCSDATAEQARRCPDPRLRVLDDGKRLGKPVRENQLKAADASQFLVILDADIRLTEPSFLDGLCAPLLHDRTVGLTSAATLPLPSDTFIGRALDWAHATKVMLYEQVMDGHGVYLCHGRARAFRRELLDRFSWEDTASEDAFSYFSCLSAGYAFAYAPSAVARFRSPRSISDHLRQSRRFRAGRARMERLFPTERVRQEYALPPVAVLRRMLISAGRHPAYAITWLLLLAATRLTGKASPRGTWEAAPSTKGAYEKRSA